MILWICLVTIGLFLSLITLTLTLILALTLTLTLPCKLTVQLDLGPTSSPQFA